jgi:RNA polymerase sigma-70 factor (ECF subfamily)
MPEKIIEQDELLLISRLQKGEEQAFRQLFDIYYRRLVAFANKLLSDIDLSRSVVQDVIVMLYEKRNEINIHTSLKSLLFQTVRNRCLNIIKRDKMKIEHHKQILENNPDFEQPFENLEYSELENSISKAIENLPEQCKKIFTMSRYEGISNQNIADELNLSKRTVETQISKALKRIREELSEAELL